MSFFTLKQHKKNKIINLCYPQQYEKRTLPPSFQRAVLTVEAAIVTPIMIFAFVLAITPMLFMNIHLSIQEKLTSCALRLNCYDFISGRLEYANDTSDIFNVVTGCMSLIYAKNLVFDDELNKALDNSIVKNGSNGASMLLSSIDNDSHIIDLICTYKIKFPFTDIIFNATQRCRIRGHAGVTLAEPSDNPNTTVYVTNSGRVYHRSIYCSYLLNYVRVDFSQPNGLIFYNHKQYDFCRRCVDMPGINTGTYAKFIYITTSGERYHFTLDCPVLQSVVYAIRLDDCKNMFPCSRCHNS